MKKNAKKMSKTSKKRNSQHHPSLLFALFLAVVAVIIVTIIMIAYNYYMYGDTSKPNNSINYEETLINDSCINQYHTSFNSIDKIIFDPDGMENGIYSLYLNSESEPYQYQGCKFWADDKDLDYINQQTVFTNFTKREENIIQSSRDLVCKYIQDSSVLTDKEQLIEQVQSIPFYMYTETYHPELLEVIDSPAVYMGVGIYCNASYSEFFCEYMFVHELIHHLRYLTSGEKISNEMYFATAIDETIADIITFTINPKMFHNREYTSGYTVYFTPIYSYLSIFKEDALKAYFYGYDDFFESYGGSTFKTEHDAFVVILDSYDSYYRTPMVCDALFTTWETRFTEN